MSRLSKFKIYLFVFIGSVFIFSCSSLEKSYRQDVNLYNQIIHDNQILIRCSLFDFFGKEIRSYPGEYCLPLRTGDLILYDGKNLIKLDKHNKKIWSRPTDLHHQLKTSSDQTKIYFFSSEYRRIENDLVRFDVFNIWNVNGEKILKKVLIFDPRTIHKTKFVINEWTADAHQGKSFEYTHYNSVQILESISSDNQKRINFLLCENMNQMCYVTDQNIEQQYSFQLFDRSIHDVSFLNTDEVIYYANKKIGAIKESCIVIFNLKTLKRRILYGDRKGQEFYNPARGGVQPLMKNNFFLISHSPEERKSKFELINLNGLVLLSNELNYTNRVLQDARAENFSEFLKNNIGN